MPDRDKMTAFSHALLAGSSIYCLVKIRTTDPYHFATGSFGIMAINSLIGVWKYGNPEYGNKVDNMYTTTSIMNNVFAIAGVAAGVHVHYGIDLPFACLHFILPTITLLQHLMDENVEEKIMDLSNVCNAASLVFISFQHDNYNGIGTALCHFFNTFCLAKKDWENVPSLVMYNIGMCFYSFLAYYTLTESHSVWFLINDVIFVFIICAFLYKAFTAVPEYCIS